MFQLKQSTAFNLPVLMVDSADHTTGKTGLTLTITASKDCAAFASISPTVTELSNGWYKLALTTSHTDTVGALAIHVTATGADPSDVGCQVQAKVTGDLSTQSSVDTLATYVDTEVGAIKTKTDSLTFTVAGQVDANIQSVNDVTVNGNGAGTPWGP